MLGYAIIGCGRIFRNHALSIAANPDARLVAVADTKPEACRKAAEEFHAHPHADYDELLRRPDVHAVSVCLPHHLHTPAVLAAARAGKHVLCEKPIALNHHDALLMIHECRRHGVKLGIVLQNRYNQPTRKALLAIEQGRFGRIIAGSMIQAVHKDPSYYQDDWHGRWATEGGGALLTQSIHTLDLLCLFLGTPAAVQAHFATIMHAIEVEDTGSVALIFDSGAHAAATVTTCARGDWWQRLDILGTRGSVAIEDNRIVRWEFDTPRPEDASIRTEDPGDKPPTAPGYGTGHPKLIADFIASIIEDRPFAISGEEGLRVSEVIWAAYRSWKSGRSEPVR